VYKKCSETSKRAGAGTAVRLILRNVLVPALVFAAVLSTSGCKKEVEPAPAVTIECAIGPRPLRVGVATITLRLKDISGKPVVGAHIALEADMSHSGMSPVFGKAEEVSAGQYEGRLELEMSGDWVVLIHVTLADGQKFDRQESVPGVEAN
jgi:hypothetical protein